MDERRSRGALRRVWCNMVHIETRNFRAVRCVIPRLLASSQLANVIWCLRSDTTR